MKTTIELTSELGDRLGFASAEIVGSLGVHPGIKGNAGEWIVTHIPTGDIAAHCPNESVAMAVAEWIEKQVPARKRKAWQSNDREKVRRVDSSPGTMGDRIRAKVKELTI